MLSLLKIEKYKKEKTQNRSGPIVEHSSQQGRKRGLNTNHQQLLPGKARHRTWDGRQKARPVSLQVQIFWRPKLFQT